ncbi:MAG TPA: DMT family transporter [Candidatus Acidoferrum sp.]|nr:DMT family transporter [Candidatus Acidoferrum sp.]
MMALQLSSTTRGVLYMLMASVFFALMNVFTKNLGTMPVAEIIFVRALIAASLCLAGIWKLGISPWGEDRKGLVLRGFAGMLSLAQGFWLLQHIPMAAATTLTHLSPIFTTLLGVWMVKEAVTPLQIGYFVVCFVGVALIQGFDVRISWLHLLIGISASFCMGLAYSSVRRLGKSEHPLVIMLYFPLVCLPLTGAAMWFGFVVPSPLQWLNLALLGVTSQLGQYFMTRSYQTAAISTVAIVSYSEVIFSIVLGLLLFAENFNLMTYLGMALVLIGVVLNVMKGNSE